MKLSSEQIQQITALIQRNRVDITTLKDDLLDHLCCVIESKMEVKKEFDIALKEALLEFAPAGLYAIQQETVYLLNYDKLVVMKKIVYLIGLLSAMAFVSGMAFTLLRLPGAREIGNYGFLVFVFIFLPFQAFDLYKANVQRPLPEKLKFVFGFSGGAIMAFAGIFKTFHYQGASELLIAGTLLLVFGFLPFFFFSLYKKAIARA